MIDDDTNLPSISVPGVDALEGTGGTTAVVLTLPLSSASTQTDTVDWSTTDGSALAPADYASASGQVSFAPGVTQRTLSLGIAGDALDEIDESLRVLFSSPVNAVLANSEAQVRILDDDAPPTLSVDDCSVIEGDEGNVSCSFRFRLSAPSGRQVQVQWEPALSAPAALESSFENPAVVGNWRTFTSGEVLDGWQLLGGSVELVRDYWEADDGAQSVDMNGFDEGILMRDFTAVAGSRYRVGFALAANGECGPARKSVMFLFPDFTGAGAQIDSGAGVNFRHVELDGSFEALESDWGLTVYSDVEGGCGAVLDTITVVTEGQAIPAADTARGSSGLTIAAGALESAPVLLEAHGDRLVEPDEILHVAVTGGTGFSGTPHGVVTILNDDSDEVFADGFE